MGGDGSFVALTPGTPTPFVPTSHHFSPLPRSKLKSSKRIQKSVSLPCGFSLFSLYIL